MERFEDLMGITHHTGDAWLDKKLNQNTAYILDKIAGGVLGAKILGKKAKVKEYGGDFAKGIRPYATEGLKDLQKAYQEGPRVFEGERVAGFTDPQLQAQAALMGLSSADPDYFQTAIGGIKEAADLQRQALGPITAEDVSRQREMLAGTAEAEKMAAQQALQSSLRDIGSAAGSMGVGQLTGARADILRGGAAADFAQTMAGIEGQLQRQALGQAEAERGRQASGAAALAGLAGQQLGVSQAGFGEEIQRAGLAEQVGAQQRALEQQQIGAEMAKFAEEDPMAFTERYLQTIYAAPTTGVQRIQKPSGLQQALGVVSTLSGAAKNLASAGMPMPVKTGGGIASLAVGGTPNYQGANPLARMLYEGKITPEQFREQAAQQQVKEAQPVMSVDGATLSTTGDMANVPTTISELTKDLASEEVKKQVQEKFKKDKMGMAPTTGAAGDTAGFDSMPTTGQIDPTPLAPADDSRMFANQAAARQLLMQRLGAYGSRNYGGGIAEYNEGGRFSKILDSVKGGLSSIAESAKKGLMTYSEDIDPFRNFSGDDRIRIGLSILATQPELGESSLGTIARGALAGVQAGMEDRLEREDTGTKSVGTFSDSEFMNIAERFFKQQNIASKKYANKLDELIRESKLEALTLAQQGLLSGTGSAFLRQAGEDIFRDKLKDLIDIPDNKDKTPADLSTDLNPMMQDRQKIIDSRNAARQNLEDF